MPEGIPILLQPQMGVDRLGYIVVTTSIVSLIAMYFVQKSVARRTGKGIV